MDLSLPGPIQGCFQLAPFGLAVHNIPNCSGRWVVLIEEVSLT